MGRARNDTTERGLKVRPPEAAQAGLVYASDVEPGIRRVRKGKGFTYFSPDGKRVTDPATLERIRGLVIPPAWKEVWISTRPRGHLQATGRDARDRKQHLYHATWRAVRDADKFSRMVGFARALPRIRRRVARDLGQPGLPREKVVATIVRLLEMTYARIGNEEYARDNGSFGLTTLRDRHVTVNGSMVRFLFKGKSGREIEVGITNRRVATVVRRCEELPGQMLFQYIDSDGERRTVHSDDVNQYLQAVSGGDYTAKDFRTWSATVLATSALRDTARFESDAEAKRNVVAAIDSVARRLGHTRAVCRRAYVHPRVIDTYLDGSLASVLSVVSSRAYQNLKADEVAVLALLKRKLPAKAA
ncbi:MAG: DNA topoisomerase IB [Candidatus Dormibacteraceae bacterium]